MNEARALLQNEKHRTPNGIVTLLENYIDIYPNGIGSKADYERLKDNVRWGYRRWRIMTPIRLFTCTHKPSLFAVVVFKGKIWRFVSSAFDAKRRKVCWAITRKNTLALRPTDQPGAGECIFGSIPASSRVLRGLWAWAAMRWRGYKTGRVNNELPKSKFSFYNAEVIFFICTADINALHNLNDTAADHLFIRNG